jgi:YfiR/HmsC-like
VEILSRRDDAACRTAGFLGAGITFLYILGSVCTTASQARAADSYSEDAVKAAYLYRFVGYVGWPSEVSGSKPFTIAVLDAPGVARELQRLLPDHPVKGGIARVREITRVQDAESAEVLYIGAGHADYLSALNSRVVSKSILFVTDEAGGLQSGSVLNFLNIDHRVRFEISLTAAERVHLKISSELLSIAIRVQGGRRPPDNARAF